MVNVVEKKNTYSIYTLYNILRIYNNVLTEWTEKYAFFFYYYFRKHKRTPRIPRRKYNRRRISTT